MCYKNKKDVWKPIVRIALLCGVILLCINRNLLFSVNDTTISTIFSIIAGLIGIVSILGIYVNIAKVFSIYEKRNRTMIDRRKLEGEVKTIEEVLSLLEKNDIIEILITTDTELIVFGTSSNSKQSDSFFFDKQFYFQEYENVSVEFIENRLKDVSDNGCVKVVSIDGVPVCPPKKTGK